MPEEYWSRDGTLSRKKEHCHYEESSDKESGVGSFHTSRDSSLRSE